MIQANPGEKLIIPPGFGHISINIGITPLVLADLFADNIASDYSFFKKQRGAAYWVLPSQSTSAKEIMSVHNPRYRDAGPLIFGTPTTYPTVGLSKKTSIYDAFVAHPDRFTFLTNPRTAWRILDTDGLCSVR